MKQNEPKVFIGTKRKTSAPGTASPSEFCKRKLQEPAELVGTCMFMYLNYSGL